ncbi:MAG TPA: TetR/AcrR family transcriptional regulator [Solirubrobacteraceae bacterium]|nr:TetR/AcrR family transcriptional regulator [Solirubrobacteraceae bacterium]
MSSTQASNGRSSRPTRRSRNEGARRAEILSAAIERFGSGGYENTKWAEIADDVGIGPTALYHYFDSKQHCLYVILDEALAELHERFDSITASHPDPRDALRAVCADCFELSEHEILRNRVLVAEQALLSGEGSSPREELARIAGREKTRALELAWTQFLADAMSKGVIPERDPRMLARAMLGLYNSIWHWYRPDQTLLLPTIAEFFTARMLAVAGVAQDGGAPA